MARAHNVTTTTEGLASRNVLRLAGEGNVPKGGVCVRVYA